MTALFLARRCDRKESLVHVGIAAKLAVGSRRISNVGRLVPSATDLSFEAHCDRRFLATNQVEGARANAPESLRAALNSFVARAARCPDSTSAVKSKHRPGTLVPGRCFIMPPSRAAASTQDAFPGSMLSLKRERLLIDGDLFCSLRAPSSAETSCSCSMRIPRPYRDTWQSRSSEQLPGRRPHEASHCLRAERAVSISIQYHPHAKRA
jgi:hypothetical protein